MNSEVNKNHHSRSQSISPQARNRISRSRSSFRKKRESLERVEEGRFNRSRDRMFDRDFRPRRRSNSINSNNKRYMKKNSRENSAENKGKFLI